MTRPTRPEGFAKGGVRAHRLTKQSPETKAIPVAKWTRKRSRMDVGQPFQADVRLESLTYFTTTSAVPLRIVAFRGQVSFSFR
jgi:hypothetical protein